METPDQPLDFFPFAAPEGRAEDEFMIAFRRVPEPIIVEEKTGEPGQEAEIVRKHRLAFGENVQTATWMDAANYVADALKRGRNVKGDLDALEGLPRWEQDDCCTYLGQYSGPVRDGGESGEYDLYWCYQNGYPTVMARWGEEHRYLSSLNERPRGMEPRPIDRAVERRVREKGLPMTRREVVVEEQALPERCSVDARKALQRFHHALLSAFSMANTSSTFEAEDLIEQLEVVVHAAEGPYSADVDRFCAEVAGQLIESMQERHDDEAWESGRLEENLQRDGSEWEEKDAEADVDQIESLIDNLAYWSPSAAGNVIEGKVEDIKANPAYSARERRLFVLRRLHPLVSLSIGADEIV